MAAGEEGCRAGQTRDVPVGSTLRRRGFEDAATCVHGFGRGHRC